MAFATHTTMKPEMGGYKPDLGFSFKASQSPIKSKESSRSIGEEPAQSTQSNTTGEPEVVVVFEDSSDEEDAEETILE